MATPEPVISDLDELEVDLIRTSSLDSDNGEAPQPESVLSHRFRESPTKPAEELNGLAKEVAVRENKIAVMVSPPKNPWEYQPFRGDTTVDTVLEQFESPDGEIWYKIEYEDGRRQDVGTLRILKHCYIPWYCASLAQPECKLPHRDYR